MDCQRYSPSAFGWTQQAPRCWSYPPERNYTGTIAGKPVNVNITRFGNSLNGYYCYEPCNQHKAVIVLRGSLQDKEVHLEERVKALSGYWNAEISSSEIKGEWTSADKNDIFLLLLSTSNLKTPLILCWSRTRMMQGVTTLPKRLIAAIRRPFRR